MDYEIKHVGVDAVTITNLMGDMMRVVSVEVRPGEFVQKAVMSNATARRVVGALKLADRVAAVAQAQQ